MDDLQAKLAQAKARYQQLRADSQNPHTNPVLKSLEMADRPTGTAAAIEQFLNHRSCSCSKGYLPRPRLLGRGCCLRTVLRSGFSALKSIAFIPGSSRARDSMRAFPSELLANPPNLHIPLQTVPYPVHRQLALVVEGDVLRPSLSRPLIPGT